ncbi:MAG: 4-hydroxy-tetrahydrodipicolinate synthase [Firmicutes bacterium]|nr:4-hydroxy-tetrahydrodipicolinate synthase [Bacillota bacterium]
MLRPSGSWVAIATPFTPDDEVAFEGFHETIDFQAGHGTSALLVMGSTGETSMLSIDERREIIKRVAPYAKGKVPTFFGVTCSNTKETIKLARFAEENEADGVLFVIPSYIRPPQEAVFQFFKTVMQSVSIPTAVYNNPIRVGVNIDPATIARLVDECPNFVADKEAMPNVSQLADVLSLTKGKLHVLCCDYPAYSITIPTLGLGGHGTANIGGNIIPEEMAAMSRPWRTFEDVERTREIFFKYYALLKMLYSVTNPVAVKAALGILGLPCGKPRLPLPEMAPDRMAEMRRLMDELGVTEKYKVR